MLVVGGFVGTAGLLFGGTVMDTSSALLGLDASCRPTWDFCHEKMTVADDVVVLRMRLERKQDGVEVKGRLGNGRLRLLGADGVDGVFRELVDAEVENADFAAGPVAEIRYLLPKRTSRPVAFKAAIGPKSFVPGRYAGLAETEYQWLRAQQLPNGAIAKVNDATTVSVNPYFSLEAVMGLLRGWPTGESRAAARRYFDWHFAHLNTAAEDYSGHDGTIYDYTVELDRPGGAITKEFPTPTPEAGLRRTAEYCEPDHPMYDSVDSYAALLFVALADYARTPSGAAYVRVHAAELARVWSALDAAFDPSGFTHARLDYYNIQYLMDNCEVYAGLVAAEFLFGETLGDSARAAAAKARRAVMEARFRSAFVDGDHFRTETRGSSFDWNQFYPSQTAPIFPVAYGVLSPADGLAQRMAESLNAHLAWWKRDWADAFHWSLTAVYGAKMRDERTFEYVDEYARRAAADHSYANGFHCGESGLMLVALGGERDFFTTAGVPLVFAEDGPYTRPTALVDVFGADAETVVLVDANGVPTNCAVRLVADHAGSAFFPDDVGDVTVDLNGFTVTGTTGASGTVTNSTGGMGLPAMGVVFGLSNVYPDEPPRAPVAEPPFDEPPETLDFVPGDYLVLDLADNSVYATNGVALAETFNQDEYKTTKIAFRKVPAGSFRMQIGEPFANGGAGSVITLMEDYWIAVFPLTQGQCRQLYPLMPRQDFGSGDMRPAHLMTWAEFNTAFENLDMRVASAGYAAAMANEAQWERALRAGTTNTYFFGESAADLGRYAWYLDNEGASGEGGVKTVGRKLPNPWGLYDLLGNVWEWCADSYYSFYADCQPGGPTVPYPDAPNRSNRGGSYFTGLTASDGKPNFASTYRGAGNPADAWIIGSRPVLTRRPPLPGVPRPSGPVTHLTVCDGAGDAALVGGNGGNGDPVGQPGTGWMETLPAGVRAGASARIDNAGISVAPGRRAGFPVVGAVEEAVLPGVAVAGNAIELCADIALIPSVYPLGSAAWLADAARMGCLRVRSGTDLGTGLTEIVSCEVTRAEDNGIGGARVYLRVPRGTEPKRFYKVEVSVGADSLNMTR